MSMQEGRHLNLAVHFSTVGLDENAVYDILLKASSSF